MKDRRAFLGSCAAGAALLMTPQYVLAAGGCQSAQKTTHSSKPSTQAFQALLHQEFRCLSVDGQAVRLELVEVRSGPQAPGLDQFGLLLKQKAGFASLGSELPAAIYALGHPQLGTHLVYLEPSESIKGGYTTQFTLRT